MKTYDFKECTAIFGPVVLAGFAEDTGVTIEPDADLYTKKNGLDGQHTRSRQNNNDYTATVKFMATSDAKAQLQATFFINALLQNDVYPFSFRCPGTNEFYFCPEAYLERDANADYSRDVGEREYKIALPNCQKGPITPITP